MSVIGDRKREAFELMRVVDEKIETRELKMSPLGVSFSAGPVSLDALEALQEAAVSYGATMAVEHVSVRFYFLGDDDTPPRTGGET